MAMIIGTGGADAYDLINDGNYNFGLEDDRIVGLGGTDFIRTGVGNDFLDGGSGNDLLADGDGDDTVIAGAGDDTVFADAGDDVFYGGEGTDTLNITNIHIGLSGSETNYTGIKLDLASTAAQDLGEFGVDRFFGFEDVICAYGNDTIFGTSGANRIATFVGNDIINGREGDDTILGGLGADTLIGGLGADTIHTAVDTFRDVIRYETLKDSGTTDATRDIISYFTHGQDKIDLSKLDANLGLKGNQAFKVVKGFTKAFGEVKLVKSGSDTIVQIDGDKDKAVDMTIYVYDAHLTKGDFIL